MKAPKNVDDLIDIVYHMMAAVRKTNEKYDVSENLGRILASADDPDSKFKCDIAVRILGNVEQCRNIIQYLHSPVMIEGELIKKQDGKVYVRDISVSEGTKLEYMAGDRWGLGYLMVNSKTGTLNIVDEDKNVIIESADKITVRIREAGLSLF